MAMVVQLVDADGRAGRGFPDPAGGLFDAAGDFDRLLGPDPRLPTWSRIDEYSDTDLHGEDLARLIDEIQLLLAMARPGPETRGLQRLDVIARTAHASGLGLRCIGD